MRPLILAVLLAAVLAAPAQAQFQSSNVSLLGKLPQSAGAIGARFSADGTTMYVSSATGLQVYDVSQPEQPRQLSQLPLPHFENEDLDVGRDTAVITNDPSFSGVGIIYLIDVSDPANPVLRSTIVAVRPWICSIHTSRSSLRPMPSASLRWFAASACASSPTRPPRLNESNGGCE